MILFSGDKLLGGPQGGIIAGKKEYIDRMKEHPLARVLRVDKMTLAAMEATFRAYLDMDQAIKQIPVLSMITKTVEELEESAKWLRDGIQNAVQEATCELVDVKDQIGGGSAPLVRLQGKGVALSSSQKTAEQIEREMRKYQIPIIGRIAEDQFILDVRTIEEDEYNIVIDAVSQIFGR